MLVESETDAETKAELKKLAEKIRFSDPISNELVNHIENRILIKIDELKASNDKAMIIRELNFLLDERNITCKKSK